MTIRLSPYLLTPSTTLRSNTVNRSHHRWQTHLSYISRVVIVAGHTHCGGCIAAWETLTKPSARGVLVGRSVRQIVQRVIRPNGNPCWRPTHGAYGATVHDSFPSPPNKKTKT